MTISVYCKTSQIVKVYKTIRIYKYILITAYHKVNKQMISVKAQSVSDNPQRQLL